MIRRILLFLFCFMGPWPEPGAWAHGLHSGSVVIDVDGSGVVVNFRLPVTDFFGFFQVIPAPEDGESAQAWFYAHEAEIANYLDSRFVLVSGQQECLRGGELLFRLAGHAHEANVLLSGAYDCQQASDRLRVLNRIFFEKPGGFRHHVVVRAGEEVQEKWFTAELQSWEFRLPQPESSPESTASGGLSSMWISLALVTLLGLAFIGLRYKATRVKSTRRQMR